MDRRQLAHLLRAAADVTGEKDLVVIGSQAVLGSFATPPDELLVSIEADLYPMRRPDLADKIDGAIGEGSQFNDTYGYYAHGVGPETAQAPAGWEGRLVPFCPPDAEGATGWCLEMHDLVLAKAVRLSAKDMLYLEVAIRALLVRPDVLLGRLASVPAAPEVLRIIDARIKEIAALL